MDQPKPLPNASPGIFLMPLKGERVIKALVVLAPEVLTGLTVSVLLNRLVDAVASGRRLPLLQGRLELQRMVRSAYPGSAS
jgi:hypothetical protein